MCTQWPLHSQVPGRKAAGPSPAEPVQYNSTTVQQYNSSTVQQYNSTTVQHYNTTTVQQYKRTTAHQYKRTTVQKNNSTTVQPCNSTTVEQNNTTVPQFCRLAWTGFWQVVSRQSNTNNSQTEDFKASKNGLLALARIQPTSNEGLHINEAAGKFIIYFKCSVAFNYILKQLQIFRYLKFYYN